MPCPPCTSQDAYVHVTKIKKWDICAGDAILRALGGRLTDLDGREVDYRDVQIVKNMVERLRD